MTPFGEKLRALRAERGVSQKAMASAIGVSAAYLSALEHGRRGAPTWTLIQKIIGYFNIIWDDAEELARLAEASHPRVRAGWDDRHCVAVVTPALSRGLPVFWFGRKGGCRVKPGMTNRDERV